MFYYAVPMQAYLIFQAESTETETGKKACGLRKKEEIIWRGATPQDTMAYP